jgi:amino acid adenylation domain-containing protein
MVPSAIMILERLPLTANGKVDRKALPAPEGRQEEGVFIEPRTPTEELVVGIYQEVLKLERVGVHDNFFELGGHSLLAVQVITRVRGVFGVELPLSNLFKAPTVAGLSERVEALRNSGVGLAVPAIRRVKRDQALPLSYAQERLWFIDQLQPNGTSYNMPGALRVLGGLQVEELGRAINEIVRRHEVLRTTFKVTVQGQPVQVIQGYEWQSVPMVDLAGLLEGERERTARELIGKENARPFDLSQGPCLRVSLLRLGSKEHIVLLTMHHIISDGWSMEVLKREIGVLYEAFSRGQPSPLPELAIQYADYAVWQREWLKGEVLEGHVEYWRRELAGAPELVELPTDRVRQPVQSFRGGHMSFEISEEVSERLKELCRREGATLYMGLQVAFQVLLYRYSGQEDIVISTGVGNRNHAETEGLIGCFINMVLMRADLSGNPGFGELLKQVRETALRSYAHQELPFELLVERLQPRRDLSHNPLTQVMLVLLNAPVEELVKPEGLEMVPEGVEGEATQLDLTLHMTETRGGLLGGVTYNSDLFERATIKRMMRSFVRLLLAATERPECQIGELPLMSLEEQEQVVVGWNDTTIEFPRQECLHHLFERQAWQRPDAVAVFFRDEAVTYGELNRRSNQLASYLRVLGVRPNDIVAICMEKSVEMIVGVLGIVKAGGGYMPLDPAYPPDRLAFMLQDAAASVVVTEKCFEAHCVKSNVRAVCLDTEATAIAAEKGSDLNVPVTSDGLAYVLYTSGSTGMPKCVMLNHQGRVNNFLDFNRRFAVGPVDRVLGLSLLNFDMSAYDMFGLFAAGGAIVVPDSAAKLDPEHWVRLMRLHRITVWHSVPVLLEMLVDQLEQKEDGHLPDLRLVLLGGDWIPVTLPNRIRALAEGVQVISMGGATEVSMDSTIYEIGPIDDSWKSIPYGRPMANQTCYVLDRNLNPVPIGVSGELYLGGVGVGWGYFNRPELSAEKFVPHPYAQEPGDRLYRTGDMVVYLPDGNLKLLGRIDHQIKIRGLRIELDEIDVVLRRHPGIKEVVVMVRENKQGNKQLVAFVVVNPSRSVDAEALRNHLKQRLPDYMVPSLFVFLEALPLSPNGKINRRVLSAMELASPAPGLEYVAPNTDTEKIVAGIWAEVLDLDRVGLHDPFFQLGGHSLLGTQVISRVRDIYPFEVPLLALFKAPTVAELAHEIEELGAADGKDVPRISKLFLETKDLSLDEMNALLAEASMPPE